MSSQSSSKWRFGSLGRRVLAAFLVVSLLPLLATALLTYWQSKSLLEGFLAENVGKTARAYAVDLDLFLERRRLLLRSISSTTDDTPAMLRGAVDGDPHLQALVWVAPSGEVVTSTGGAMDDWAVDACRALLGDPNQAMTHAGQGHAHSVVVAVPRRAGVLCGQVTFTLHQDMLTERAHSIGGGTAYIVDRSGTVVCHAFEAHEAHVGRGDMLVGTAAEVAAAAVPWSGMTDGQDGLSFAAFAPSETLPWGVWVEIPRDVAAAPLRTYLMQTLLYVGLFAAFACLLAVLLVRYLIWPIQDVVEAVRTIAMGRYGDEVPVRGDDEIADLAREFNRMSSAVYDAHVELDQRVIERTWQLEAAREFSDLLLNTMRQRILVINLDLRIVRANDAALQAYGGDIVGRMYTSVFPGQPCTAEQVIYGGVGRSEERVFELNGRTEILAVDTYSVPGGRGERDAVVEIARDVTELKRMQSRLIHQEKMAAVGTLASGLAHEIGNPLASMSSELEMLEQMWDPQEARNSLPVLRDQVRRISLLLHELVDFGRAPSDEPAEVLVGRLVEDVARLLRHDPRSRGVNIRVQADAETVAYTVRDRIFQVLVNLGLNALDALDGSGDVTFRATAQGSGGVQFQVLDDGPGMAQHVVKQVFDPFFTTKAPDRGTGLGLFVSERIIEGLGGHIEIQSRESEGTTFTVVLPAPGRAQEQPT
ncbi:MAG: signal transduction histidine kinase [Kiritimatiellia bacterium]